MSTAGRKYDLVVFGASGFTGQYVVEEVARTIGEEKQKFTWAVAGRDRRKIQNVLSEAARQTGKSLDDINIVIADVKDEASLQAMCHQTRVILNCVGPYRFYGEPIVQACIVSGTHHLDVSGEEVFLERTQLLYDDKARQKGTYILGSCGFDSIPSDLGVEYARQQFNGDVNDIEGYVRVNFGPEGGCGNFGTWQTAIHEFANVHELKEIRQNLSRAKLPRSNHPMPKRLPLFKSKEVGGWCLPFVGCDRSVVSRTQRYNYEHRKLRPIKFNAYFNVPNIFEVGYMMLVGLIFGVCAMFSFGRYLLETFPRLMSLGAFSATGPTRKQIEGCSFTMTLLARGYDTKIEDLQEQHSDPPNKKVVVKVTGPEAGYVATPICMVQAAYTLLAEKDNMPEGGGVYTPGAAFAKTSLIDRLNKHNVKFTTEE